MHTELSCPCKFNQSTNAPFESCFLKTTSEAPWGSWLLERIARSLDLVLLVSLSPPSLEALASTGVQDEGLRGH